MRRRRGDDSGSMELLLDTICNVFGGIVFIAILVALLTSARDEVVQEEAAQSVQTPSITDIKRLEHDRDVLVRALEQLEVTRKTMVDHGVEEVMAAVDDLEQANKEVATQAKAFEEWLQNVRQTIEGIETQETDLQETQEKLTEVKSHLTETHAEVRLPMAQRTRQTQVLFWLREGRLHWIPKSPSDSVPFSQTQVRDVDQQYGILQRTVTVRPNSGMPVNARLEEHPRFKQLVYALRPGRHFFYIFISEDSAEQFQLLRDALVRRGFSYNIVPFLLKDELTLVNVSGVDAQ